MKAKTMVTRIIIVLAVIFTLLPITVYAKEPLDEIQDYTVTVDLRPDGTADIKYHLEWKVLDDSSEGPLEWVKIGIANENVDEITALTSNISKIKYYPEGSDDYVRIDFDRKYYAGEVINFDFSLHQSHLYVMDKEEHLLRYSFTPGWFPEIEVKNITIKWNKNNVIKTSAEQEDSNGYYVWNGSLSFDERLNASVSYNLDAYAATEEGQAQEKEEDGIPTILVIILIVLIVILVIVVLVAIFSNDDDYGSGRGYGGGSHYRSTYIHTHHSSCVSSCACVHCACACACAGGGRAGCSKKDFYGTNLKKDMMDKVLSEELD